MTIRTIDTLSAGLIREKSARPPRIAILNGVEHDDVTCCQRELWWRRGGMSAESLCEHRLEGARMRVYVCVCVCVCACVRVCVYEQRISYVSTHKQRVNDKWDKGSIIQFSLAHIDTWLTWWVSWCSSSNTSYRQRDVNDQQFQHRHQWNKQTNKIESTEIGRDWSSHNAVTREPNQAWMIMEDSIHRHALLWQEGEKLRQREDE